MLTRRQWLARSAALALSAGSGLAPAQSGGFRGRLFDCHCHIIDPRFPLVQNQGYTPSPFPLAEYRARVAPLGIMGGAIVSGSFHGHDQTYLKNALAQLGYGWAGVTQLPADVPDAEIAALSMLGVRALRFNLFRGRIDNVDELVSLAGRARAAGGMHAEIYADAATLAPHVARLAKLPQLVIDHLGMSEAGLPVVLDLVDAGAKVKATGFGRVKMNVPAALERIARRDPRALMFGTDLPSTRAERPFADDDIGLIRRVFGAELAHQVLWDNAVDLYRPPGAELEGCL